MTNPDPRFHGQPTMDGTGEQKSLKKMLIERGFDVTGMKAKCSPLLLSVDLKIYRTS